MTNNDLARETFLQTAAISRGYQLVRSESDTAGVKSEGYVLLDTERHVTLLGGESPASSLTLEQVESFLMDGPRVRQRYRPS